MTIPNWYSLLLVGIAAWRTFQLLAYDDILNRPRRWALRLDPNWEEEGDPVGDKYRVKWAIFITCPYCAGFWISVGWFIALQVSLYWTVIAALPFVLNTIVVAGSKLLSKEEDKTAHQDEQEWRNELVKALREVARAQRKEVTRVQRG